MKRKRPVRPRRPYIATPDQVRITRDAFVPADEVYEEPAIEVRKPKRGR